MSAHLLNRDVFRSDPAQHSLQNNGVSQVDDTAALRYELETFVCEGEYEKGLDRILTTYLSHLDLNMQPSAWVSGFYGSGKSHLVKILEALWTNVRFDDGQRARDVANLTGDISTQFVSLSAEAKRAGGLWAASGMLAESQDHSVRMLILGIVHRAAGFSSNYGRAKFRLWLRKHGWEEPVIDAIREAGFSPEEELNDYLVSPIIANTVHALAGSSTMDADGRQETWGRQFDRSDISMDDMISDLREILSLQSTDRKSIPLTLIVLDEVQQYISENGSRAQAIQEAVERIQSSFESRVLVVATGQAALNTTPNLQKLQGRFTTNVMLSDKDVEQVVRKVVLRKDPAHVPAIEATVQGAEGEIDRHLRSTSIGPRSEDKEILVADYPLLPTRGRFWANLLHRLDPSGAQAQLRSQLRIVHSAAIHVADKPLGHTIAADFVYEQLHNVLLQSGALPRDISNLIADQEDGTDDGKLPARLIQLIFLIERLPSGDLNDVGVRATPDILADLLVEDVTTGSDELRRRIPDLLAVLEEDSKLIRSSDGAYAIQTGESLKWDQEFRRQRGTLDANPGVLGEIRSRTLEELVRGYTSKLQRTQGQSRTARQIDVNFGNDAPEAGGGTSSVVVWVRDGWNSSETSVRGDAREVGDTSAIIQVFIPRERVPDVQKAIATAEAAKRTLDIRGGTRDADGGQQAADHMRNRQGENERLFRTLLTDITAHAKVYQGGGTEVDGATLQDKLQVAFESSLRRLFPRFSEADHPEWDKVFTRASQGNGGALAAVGHHGDDGQHSVVRDVRRQIPGGSGATWASIRKTFQASPYGWPQDAVDAAIAVLVNAGSVNAKRNDKEIRGRDLTKQQANATQIIGEDEIVSTSERILARRPFLAVYGKPATDDEVRAGARDLVGKLIDLSRASGGEPPLPLTTTPAYLTAMENLTGNSLIKALAASADQIDMDIATWRAQVERIKERHGTWLTLERLVAQARHLEGYDDIASELSAIRDNRQLLADPNPVTPLRKTIGDLLRQSLKQRTDRYATEFESRLAELKAADEWLRLNEQQRDRIVAVHRLQPVRMSGVSSDGDLLRALDGRSLYQWDDSIGALSARFDNALRAVIEEIRPGVIEVSLEKPLFERPVDVEIWIRKTRDALLLHVNDGHAVRIK